MNFDTYWKNNGIKSEVGVLENAFREIAEKAWNAAKEDVAIDATYVNYGRKDDPQEVRYQQLASSPLPDWAADVKQGRFQAWQESIFNKV